MRGTTSGYGLRVLLGGTEDGKFTVDFQTLLGGTEDEKFKIGFSKKIYAEGRICTAEWGGCREV